MCSIPDVLALDFDGVVCDGLKEYFQTAWKAYSRIWNVTDLTPSQAVVSAFNQLRPVVETGWEMPVLLRALSLGTTPGEIFRSWGAIASEIMSEDGLKPLELSQAVDSIRDEWIATDVNGWLAEHEFYPGVIERLKATLNSATEFFIISTKEGRFIQQLLQGQGISLTAQQVYGKESKRPKYQILQELKSEYSEDTAIWFVEDRLKTLQAVKQQPGLEKVELFLADWGYNTATERQETWGCDRIHLLTLDRFGQDFSAWI